jgi:integral membrane sensor domain MASE1
MTLDQALTLLAGAAGIYIALSALVGILILSIVGIIFYKVWSHLTRTSDRKF